jgi:CubicO group peptidase (beta-lactamase class C family)
MVTADESASLPAAHAILVRALAEHAFPGAVAAVGRRAETARFVAAGRLAYAADAPEVGVATVYDLASLTKVIATTTIAMLLHDEGRLDLDQPACAWVPSLRGDLKQRVTVRHLLSHSSGIAAWAPLFRETTGVDAYVERIANLDLVHPPGTRAVYSDLGFILLGTILERVAGEPWERLVPRRVLSPLEMSTTGYCPQASERRDIAPTELCPWRGRLIQGEVHDENAFAMGGVAPHAGLFGAANDVARFAGFLLSGGVIDGRRLVASRTIELFTRRSQVPGSTRALGWDTPSDSGYSTAGAKLSRLAFGHTGFTGTSLWIDPVGGLFVMLLSNRIHPTRENQGIRWVRPAIADALAQDAGLD